MAEADFVIITGLSGAGKSLTMKCFEDLGFFCVDNLPPALIPKFAQLCAASSVNQMALVIDVRGRRFFPELRRSLEELTSLGFAPRILFLEADDRVLVRRYSESRRRHPLAPGGGILEGIKKEREALAELRDMAQNILNTSKLSPNQLMRASRKFVDSREASMRIAVHVQSFGFKYGLPLDADMVLDVRFLPNPFYVPDLSPMSGLDEPVRDYVIKRPEAQDFLDKAQALLESVLPSFLEEGKQNLTVAVGCTGGRHRSTAMSEQLGERLRRSGYSVNVQHRDVAQAEHLAAR